MKREAIFLTPEEALAAVIADLGHYPPQLLVVCEILRLLSGDGSVVRRAAKKPGAWISVPGRRDLQWMDGPALVHHLCERLSAVAPCPELLARICSRMFQTRAAPWVDAQTGSEGIRLETGMEHFVCRQCGRCCRALDYREALSRSDVEKWRAAGRSDILEWVGIFREGSRQEAYRMWVDPETRQPVSSCPFLAKDASSNRWLCRIQDAKPSICRQYPFSRKHARMTGCPGFDKANEGG